MESGALYSLITFIVVLLVYAIATNRMMWKLREGGMSENEMKIPATKINSEVKRITDNRKYNSNTTRLNDKHYGAKTIFVVYAWYSYEYKGKKRTVKLCDTDKSHMPWYSRIGSYYVSLNEYQNSFPQTMELLINSRTGKFKSHSTNQKLVTFFAVFGFIVALAVTVLMAVYVYHYVPEVVYDFIPRK